MLATLRSPAHRGLAVACLAVLYGPLAALVENAVGEGWSLTTALGYTFLYTWLAVFVYLGYRAPAYRIRLFTSGVIPLTLWGIALAGVGDLSQLPPLVLMLVAIFLSPKDEPRSRRR